VVELKYDLQTMSECNRLVGQVGGYVDFGADVIVLLCGNTKQELAKCVARRLATFTNERLFRKGHVFTVPLVIRGPNGRFISATRRPPQRDSV
jgi:hypothetical protein